jgi:crotonobetainyl-CoA:carnitine CoA-transferase CaiB-like acyl-CoA transferase
LEPLAGITVVELASWIMVPSAGAVLSDWGAQVIKIEHPETGDPQRGLQMGLVAGAPGDVNGPLEQGNRGKRSLGLDVSSEDGRALLLSLLRDADVFLTNLLPGSLQRLRLGVEDVQAVNPRIVYARGHGWGVRGPWADKGGYDSASYWARGGVAYMHTAEGAPMPAVQRPAFGDIMGGMTLAGGVAAALVRRNATGEPSVVDVSLLGVGAWQEALDVVIAGLGGQDAVPSLKPELVPNPLALAYRTADGRFIQLALLQSDRFWPELCSALERPDLLEDPRFATGVDRTAHREACRAALMETFGAQPLRHWEERLSEMTGVWATHQSPADLHDDPQVQANGYLPLVHGSRHDYRLVANPVQFDERPPALRRAPEHGEHTDEICLEAGLDWEQIIALKVAGVIN